MTVETASPFVFDQRSDMEIKSKSSYSVRKHEYKRNFHFYYYIQEADINLLMEDT